MIQRRMAAAGIAIQTGNHSFRATGITAYLKNGGTLEKAAAMANHASTRTTQGSRAYGLLASVIDTCRKRQRVPGGIWHK